MYNITLPATGPKLSYYNAYVGYFRSILDYNHVPYSLDGCINVGEVVFPTATKFLMKFNNKKVVIDFSDNVAHMPDWEKFDAHFKFHYTRSIQGDCKTIYPFAPISFYDWEQYNKLQKVIHYSCNNNVVLNMQRPGGNALERRKKVRNILNNKYGKDAILQPKDTQEDYWKRINNCLVHVFVPGCRNNMIDRGHIQYLAFGCCTISPRITDELPYDGILIPGVHYIMCKDDYSDLLDCVTWVRNNRTRAREIGRNAKELFQKSCRPEKLWDWILEKINE